MKSKPTPKESDSETVVADKPEETPRKEFLRLFNELYILNDPTEAEKPFTDDS